MRLKHCKFDPHSNLMFSKVGACQQTTIAYDLLKLPTSSEVISFISTQLTNLLRSLVRQLSKETHKRLKPDESKVAVYLNSLVPMH